MSDAPMLPTVRTDEDLDILYGRTGRPKYQGIDEPSPWDKQEILPQSQRHHQHHHLTHHQQSPVTPMDVVVMRSGDDSGDGPGDDSGDGPGDDSGDGQEELREYFETIVNNTRPRNGYSLTEEDLYNHGTAYQVVLRAVELGYSKNWMCEHLFKIPKGGTGAKYKLLSELVSRVQEDI